MSVAHRGKRELHRKITYGSVPQRHLHLGGSPFYKGELRASQISLSGEASNAKMGRISSSSHVIGDESYSESKEWLAGFRIEIRASRPASHCLKSVEPRGTLGCQISIRRRRVAVRLRRKFSHCRVANKARRIEMVFCRRSGRESIRQERGVRFVAISPDRLRSL